ncbi:ATP-dependent helicase YprA (DUF1998 family) [Solirubrobacter pauli]|uniref:ATP-dependent helicase YprA (DUF1998 family) n=1 Tax=Solirubrobacter pauli TaxID=166793 RepID=A0A660LDT1_9ACTN|nr:DEAD/DEAH box helicase [Solirubrobacter pauli]RKQ90891.1 ATP-dependent helicase YprA (DUF1998 family) [Solirubrobacter pauli]
MSELLPGVQAPAIREGLLDYLSTTFALADEDARAALIDFLSSRENGIFKGPYLRVRLPFQPAAPGWRDALDWYEGPTPYGHQAAAFARLSSLDVGPAKSRPRPTLITTGTGSGKTEAFLYPILDHVLRARRRGVTGTKALLLYPMNALANDQAQRLAALISGSESLSGVTAAIYTGEQSKPARSKVSADGLINRRDVIRTTPPDILLTNYKMLDQMLLREPDARIWRDSATSLQYLVLDEFHTYDGAQGTDVTMLLRRLGITLKSYWPDGVFTEADRARPLGVLTPVATSATLGDKGDPAAMLQFARTVFGEAFEDAAVITEARLSFEDWSQGAATAAPRTDREAVETAVNQASTLTDGRAIAEAVFGSLFETPEPDLLALSKAHPFTRTLVEQAEHARPISELAAILLPALAGDPATRHIAETFTLLYSAALSHVRKVEGRSALSLDLHLWIRELTRIDRVALGSPEFLWSDDTLAGTAGDAVTPAFPALFCRHCGRSGWAVVRAPIGGFDLTAADSSDIRRARLADSREFRALIHAPAEGETELDDEPPTEPPDPDEPRLLWFYPSERRVLAHRPELDADVAAGRVLPVLAHTGPKAGRFSADDTCPSCMQKDGIRFLGSAIATLLSVSLSTIFGSDDLDKAEKKALIFTDSVQDAAHRAGFVQSRSHSLTLRSVFRRAVGEELIDLEQLVDRALQQAGDDPHRRYRLLPPDFADHAAFTEFWRRPRQSQVPTGFRRRVRRRLALDAVLEFGLQARLGRTLELTGSLAAEVDIAPATIVKVVGEVEKIAGPLQLEGMGATDRQRSGWVRGVLERMRTDGAIQHEWFRKYQLEDGRRYSIWGGRPRWDGMPAFPRGRGAPAYPRVGGSGTDSDLVSAGSAQSWYAVWTARALGCTANEGASLTVTLLNELAKLDIVHTVNTNSGGQVFELPQSRILVGPVDDEGYSGRAFLLACDICGAAVPGTTRVVDELEGLPCLVSRCTGTLVRAGGRPDNFYRRLYHSADATRIVAREHTSLLEDELRLEYENQFKVSADNPQAPNVLVATPTLEMGIDIGDLSTVMLASLPKSVASYLQRVGRAGRLTGSALNLAFVSGRGEQLPRLGDPLSVINGQVRPPATYIDAEEILRRQYVASVADRLARAANAPHPATATQAIGTVDAGSFLHAVIEAAERPANLEAFLDAFESLSEPAREQLRLWSKPHAEPRPSPLAAYVHAQHQRWKHEVEIQQHRIQAIQASLPELEQRAGSPAATEDDKVALRTAKAARRLAGAQLDHLQGQYWISILEEHGILPNYTLLDDAVALDVTLSWIDPDTQEYMSEPATFNRGAASALREFAPGATFYARGHRIEVDAVDLGVNGEAIGDWVWCPSCGFGQDVTEQPSPAACPRCGDAGISDVQQRLPVVELQRVSSAMRREEAAIDDVRDDRERVAFNIVTAADIDVPRRQWFVDGYPFGVKHLTDTTIRWLNLGNAAEPGGTRLIAGAELTAPLFRVCAGCGKLDSRTGQNSPAEHRPWCVYRNTSQEQVKPVALGRTLRTEVVVVQLPAAISVGDRFAVPSLLAAFQLGLTEHLGGAPDHLAFERIVITGSAEAHEAILIHDTVPGGTGYLAELADPEAMYAVLHRAWTLVRDCPCKDEGRASCHRCLSPYINSSTQKHVSRVAAERYLRTILLAGGAGEPAAALSWTVTEQQTTTYDPETHIEQLLRTVLFDRLTAGLGASVQEQPGPYGNRWTINIGGRTWVMEPQLPLAGVKPDFVFYSNDQSIPRLALFCDGWQFHASPMINRLADDAQKRASLRDQGYVVIGLTWQDLLDAQHGSTPPPLWFAEQRWTLAMQATGGALKPGLLELVKGGPIDFLARWISQPDPAGIEALADALPLLLVGAGGHGKAESAAPVLELAQTFHDGSPLPTTGERPVWAWRHDTLSVVARNHSGKAAEIVVLLDDRDDRLGQQHKVAWREWIRLANLLNRSLQPTFISTYSLTSGPQPATETSKTSISAAWAPLHAGAVGDAEKQLILSLADTACPLPTQGHETESGLPLALAWIEHKVAVNLELTADDLNELAADGWTVVAPDAVSIGNALAGGQ